MIDEATLRRLVQLYGYEFAKSLGVQNGYRNYSYPVKLTDGRVLNIMVYKNEPYIVQRIRSAHAVTGYLAAHGLPVRQCADQRLVRLRAHHSQRYAGLYNYLPGNTIPWESYTQRHLKLLGKSLSDLHADLQTFDAAQLPAVIAEYEAIVGRMQSYLSTSGVQHAMAMKLNLVLPESSLRDCLQLLRLCRRLPNQQALHMDFVRGNILFATATDKSDTVEISGILDFEKVARGHPVFDIARTLAFLLVDCKYKPHDKVYKYFLVSGYHRRGQANWRDLTVKTSAGTVNVLDGLLDLFLIHDFYKFLRHNPYDYLDQNEHFRRTRDLLLGRSRLRLSHGLDSPIASQLFLHAT